MGSLWSSYLQRKVRDDLESAKEAFALWRFLKKACRNRGSPCHRPATTYLSRTAHFYIYLTMSRSLASANTSKALLLQKTHNHLASECYRKLS